MRLSDLWNVEVKTLDGERLGRVHDVYCEGGKVIALDCGARSIIERLTAKRQGRRIPWECVRKIGKDAIVVTPEPPKRKKPSGSRTPRRTRQPSARRSKR